MLSNELNAIVWSNVGVRNTPTAEKRKVQEGYVVGEQDHSSAGHPNMHTAVKAATRVTICDCPKASYDHLTTLLLL